MVPVEDARQLILDNSSLMDVVLVDLEDAFSSYVAEDLVSDMDIAPFDNTAMDGFAFRAADVAMATEDAPVPLEIIGHIGAGYIFDGTVGKGQAVRIMTGAAMPQGADCVEKIENVTCTGEGTLGDRVLIGKPVEEGRNVRKAGSEIRQGELVMRAGERVDSAAAGLLASTGHPKVPVYRRPRVGIMSLGSELVEPDILPGPGMIRESNSYALSAAVKAAGCEPVNLHAVRDDEGQIRDTLARLVETCDLVVSSGGASAGDYDFITQVADSLGEVYFKYVNMRPGKSQTFAVIDGVPFLGLAGNPAAAAIGFEVLVRPALLKMRGAKQLERSVQMAALCKDMKKKDPRRNYLRGRVERTDDGGLIAIPADKQSSAMLTALHQSNCLIVQPEDLVEFPQGTPMRCIRIDIEEGTVI